MNPYFKSKSILLSAVCLSMNVTAPVVSAGITQSIEDALKLNGGEWGQIKFNLRYRFENVNQEDIPKETANASTLRLRLGYLTPEFQGLQGYAEMEVNQDIGQNDYNSTRNGKTRYSVIADPQEVELNQLWVSYSGIPDTAVKVGRQVITYDKHRFVGHVNWRQMQQTYDSVTVSNQSIADVNVQAAFIWRTRDIFSKNVNMTSPLLNVSYSGLDFGKLTAYGYWLDYDDQADSGGFAKSTQTYGIRFEGSQPIVKDLKAHYTTEYAFQKDYKHNPKNFETDYMHLSAGVTAFVMTGKVGVEYLTSDNGVGFSTPLATLHAYQGWADQFLATPGDGIQDVYGSFTVKLMGAKFMAVYHDFDDDSGSIDHGEEIDFLIVKKFGKHYKIAAKYANYNAKNHNKDTQKVWIQANIDF